MAWDRTEEKRSKRWCLEDDWIWLQGLICGFVGSVASEDGRMMAMDGMACDAMRCDGSWVRRGGGESSSVMTD